MEEVFKDLLMKAAIRKEAEYAENLAGNHALKMIDEIYKIMDKPMLSVDEKYDEIMKVVFFANVPPHI